MSIWETDDFRLRKGATLSRSWKPNQAVSILLAFLALIIGMGQALASELAGTSWQLVEIASMNDTVERPDDASKYTLSFGEDGTASIQADCNRGKGSWTSASTSQLQFGDIASTRALCPPGSISEKYLAEFQWVRSYVMEGGHLFLATMSDGSIIEFEPMSQTETAASLLGEAIRESDPELIQAIILERLFNAYADRNKIAAEPSEIDAFVDKMERGMREEGLTAMDDLTDEEREQAEKMRMDMAQSVVTRWQINKALYEEYGGRIIYQQLGPEPLDAYRKFLKERQQAGDFEINDEAVSDVFWRYFTNDSIHSFMEAGSDDEKRAFSVPPWTDGD